MLAKIVSIIAREEVFLAKFEPGTSQHSLPANCVRYDHGRLSANLRTEFLK